MISYKYTFQAESQLHRLGQAGGSIGLHMIANKAEYMRFNRKGAISTLNAGPLKLVNKFTYLSSHVSSSESDVNILLENVWTDSDRLSIKKEVCSIR